jgi:hypothetical protein
MTRAERPVSVTPKLERPLPTMMILLRPIDLREWYVNTKNPPPRAYGDDEEDDDDHRHALESAVDVAVAFCDVDNDDAAVSGPCRMYSR